MAVTKWVVEQTPQRLVVKLGAVFTDKASCVFDKTTGRARFERRVFFIRRKPIDVALSEIVAFEVPETSGQYGDTFYPRVTLASGRRFHLSDAYTLEDTHAVAQTVRDFLGVAQPQSIEPS